MFQKIAHTYKRLVYAFYCSEDDNNDYIKQLHYRILERYINIFDEVIFCIIINDVNDIETIKNVEKRILSMCHNDISFKIYENTNYRETHIFYEEIFLRMKDLYGSTFFAHSKGGGVMNSREEIIAFILGAYFFSLEKNENVPDYPFYGSFKMVNNGPISSMGTKYDWFYVGTFFWGNYEQVYNEKKMVFPIFSTRWFDEMFPGELYEEWKCGSLNNCCFRVEDRKPVDAFDLIETTYGKEPIFGEYLKLYNELIDEFAER